MERVQLLKAVRKIVKDNPDRHDQGHWLSNCFDGFFMLKEAVHVEDLREYAGKPLPDEPEDRSYPVCGTTGCVAGWLAVLGGEDGIILNSTQVVSPHKGCEISDYAARLAGLDVIQAVWLFAYNRTRDQILTALDMLIEDEDAEIWGIQ